MKLFAFFLFISLNCISQEPPPVMQQQMEEWGEAKETEEVEDDSQLQQWDYYKRNPLNLNSASGNDLLSLRLLSEFQVSHLLAYRQLLGEFLDLYELQAVPFFDLRTIQRILPYITVESSKSFRSDLSGRLKQGNHQVLLRWSATLEKAVGFNTQLPVHFLGDGNQVFLRYRYQGKQVQFGMVAEKDKGEQFFRGAQKTGFDFYSFHFFIQNIGKIKTLAIGDFVINLGQGLVHWQSMGAGKGMQLFNAKRESPVLLPYRSAGEFNFMRGGGLSFRLNKFDFTLFGSYRKLGANTTDSSDNFSGFYSSSLYRTSSEIADKNKIGMATSGLNIKLQGREGSASLNGLYYHMSKELRKDASPENRFIPGGKDFYFLSFDYSRTYKNLHFFGEVALDKFQTIAITNGVVMSVDAKVDLAFHYRKIPKEYYSLFGNAFTENSLPGNEEGLFGGITIRPVKGLTIHSFADLFSFPWLRYRADAPTKGVEYLCALDIQPNRQSSVLILYRHKIKPLNNGINNFDIPVDVGRQSLRLHFSRDINSRLVFRSRAEFIIYKEGINYNEYGFMHYIESIYSYSKWNCGLRFQWFETDSYNSRIYNYEADVLFSSSIVPVYEKGLRYYFNWRYEYNKNVSVCGRFSQTSYADKTSVGSGYNAISGSKKTDIKLQLLLNF